MENEILREHYDRESLSSFEVARRYREKINPVQRELPENDVDKIKEEVFKRAGKELRLRIDKGYEGVKLGLLGEILEKVLEELKIL